MKHSKLTIVCLLQGFILCIEGFSFGSRLQLVGFQHRHSHASTRLFQQRRQGIEPQPEQSTQTPSPPRRKISKAKLNAKRRRFKKHPQIKNSNTRATSIAMGEDPLLSLNMNLDYLAKTGRAEHAEELLLKIEKLFDQGYYAIRPDSVSYNSVMNAYALSDDPKFNSATEVLRIFQRMQDLTNEGQATVQPNVVTLNTVIATFGKNGQPDKARQLLNDMEELYQSGQVDMSPNTITYNTVIAAFAKAKMPQEAEDILKQMMRKSREDDEARVDVIKADAIAFNTVLHAWCISGVRGSADRAHQLLDHMVKLYNAGNKDCKPDVFSYTSTIAAHAQDSKNPNSSDKALELLYKMENECALGNEDMCPNTVAYTAVINALAKSRKPGAAMRSFEILMGMEAEYKKGNEDLRPDMICYSSVISAFAKSGGEEEDAGLKALELLDHMITLAENGNAEVGPNTQVYCSVITALGKSRAHGAADSAQKLLNDMERMYAFGNNDVAPNTIIFNAVLDAWAKSSFVFKADKANEILHRMEEELAEGNIMYKPDIITYNSVISAGANSFGDNKVKRKAFKIALDAFRKVQLSEDILPTTRTYMLLFKAIRKLIRPQEQRESMAKQIVKYCLRDGLFNSHILRQLELIYSTNRELVTVFQSFGYEGSDDSSVKIKNTPASWRCNVHRIK